MTPAERTKVRDHASLKIGACECVACLTLAAATRYVPPGDAVPPHPWRVRHDGCGMVAVTLDAMVVCMEPDAARRLAHALHAAADAAEETDR